MSLPVILMLLATCIATATSQILFKRGTTLIGPGSGSDSASNLTHRFVELLMLPSFLIALFLYGLAFVLWIYLISKNSFSLLYPIGLSLNVILALIAAHFYLGEKVMPLQVVGVAVIIAGIFLVAK